VLEQRFWQYAWALTVVAAPVFVVGGVAFAQPGLVKITESEPQVSLIVSETIEKESKPKNAKPVTFGKWKTWRKVPHQEKLKIVRMSVVQVIDTYGVDERTAYHWLEYARRDTGIVGEVAGFQDEISAGQLVEVRDGI